MKKLMIVFAAVAVAAASQAASFSWTSTSKAYALDAANVTDNGNYAVSTSTMRNNGTWNYVLTIYAVGTETLVDSFTGTLNTPASGRIGFTTSDSSKVASGTAYDYVLQLTGTQTALNARGAETAYDYTNAELAYTYAKGSVTTLDLGATVLTGTTSPTTWTVSGIEPIPEPTSGLLLLLGMAGLALRRKQK